MTAGTSGAVRRTAVLVMDTSNSMRGEKIEAARSAALAYVDGLPDDVSLGIVTFARSVAQPLAPTQDRAAARDVMRAGVSAGWQQDRLVGPGVILGTELQGRVDAYVVSDDPSRDAVSPRAWEAAGVTLRWPLIRQETGTDATQVIEPVASLSYAAQQGTAPANEDSRLPEFGAATLHTLDRLPGEDLQETGLSAGLGLRWSRTATNGRTLSVLAGQLLRDDDLVLMISLAAPKRRGRS